MRRKKKKSPQPLGFSKTVSCVSSVPRIQAGDGVTGLSIVCSENLGARSPPRSTWWLGWENCRDLSTLEPCLWFIGEQREKAANAEIGDPYGKALVSECWLRKRKKQGLSPGNRDGLSNESNQKKRQKKPHDGKLVSDSTSKTFAIYINLIFLISQTSNHLTQRI